MGWDHYAFFRILSGPGRNVHAVKLSTAEIQRSQTVKGAMRSSGQVSKMMVTISVTAVTTAECHPLVVEALGLYMAPAKNCHSGV